MSYTIDLKDNIRTVICTGSLTGTDLPELAEQLSAARTRNPRAMDILADLSRVSEIEIDISTMENFAAGLLRLILPKDIKIALVARTQIQYSYAESFKILSDHPQLEVRVFRHKEDALEWLSEDGSQKERNLRCVND